MVGEGAVLRLALMSAAHCHNGVSRFRFPQQSLSSSVISCMTTAPHDRFVAPQRRVIGAGFAAQGHRYPCREQHWTAPVQLAAGAAQTMATAGYAPTTKIPTLKGVKLTQIQNTPTDKNEFQTRVPQRRRGAFFSVHRLSAFARSINTLLHAAYCQLIRAGINSTIL